MELSKGLNYRKHSFIDIISGILNPDFESHLEHLFNAGISWHGSNYLNNGLRSPIHFSSWALEMCFENIRRLSFPEMPSRFQSVFGWTNLSDAEKFRQAEGGRIYAIQPMDAVAVLDMNLITGSREYFGSRDGNAKAYWGGNTPQTDGYSPIYEAVMKCPVKILGVV
jgi:hypothetical protein